MVGTTLTHRGSPPATGLIDPRPRSTRRSYSERLRRLLAADLTYIPHLSFDDPGARDAILGQRGGTEVSGPARIPACRDADTDTQTPDRFPSREREADQFRRMNYLKYLASRIRDGIDPDSPSPIDLEEAERRQAEALRIKNGIAETHLRLAVSVAQRYFRSGYGLPDRISDATYALLQAVDRFDFARGNRFSTYATWAIINELSRQDRRERRHRIRAVVLHDRDFMTTESEGERYEREEFQEACGAAVERLLHRLDGRERQILINRNGIGGVPEKSLREIGLDLGISKERVRQIEQRAHAKLRGFARLEAIVPSEI